MSFRDFIDHLRENGRLVEITDRTCAEYETARIAKNSTGPMLFHDVNGS